jgi:hypothetical protein
MALWQPGYFPAMTYARKVFIGSTTYAGIAIPAYNATAQVFGLWNPAGSGVDLTLVKLNLAIATQGTQAQSALGLSYLPNTGNAVGASGAPITAFTQTASVPGLVGDAAGVAAPSAGRFTLSATTIAPTFFYNLSLSETAGSTPQGIFWAQHDFDGCVSIAPGTYVGLGGSAAPGSTYQATLIWFETPAV